MAEEKKKSLAETIIETMGETVVKTGLITLLTSAVVSVAADEKYLEAVKNPYTWVFVGGYTLSAFIESYKRNK